MNGERTSTRDDDLAGDGQWALWMPTKWPMSFGPTTDRRLATLHILATKPATDGAVSPETKEA
jgi:hypothetical protein